MATQVFRENMYQILLKCTLCRQNFDRPKSLPLCSHVFCTQCLFQRVSSSRRAKLSCPSCNVDNTAFVPDGDIDSLPDAEFMVRIRKVIDKARNEVQPEKRFSKSSVIHRLERESTPVFIVRLSRRPFSSQGGFQMLGYCQYKCPVCSIPFSEARALQSHVDDCITDKNQGYFTCPQCGDIELLEKVSAIQGHLTVCMPDIAIERHYIQKSPVSDDDVDEHDGKIRCSMSEVMFENMAAFREHKRRCTSCELLGQKHKHHRSKKCTIS